MKKKILASLLAGIILATSILPTASFAQEDLGMERTQVQETNWKEPSSQDLVKALDVSENSQEKEPVSNELDQLRFFVDGKEVYPTTPLRKGVYKYQLNLPRGTKEITLKVRTKDYRAKTWVFQDMEWKEMPQDDVIPLKYEGKEDLNTGYRTVRMFYVGEKESDLSSKNPYYYITFNVAGYPKPVIQGVKEHYIFEKGETVTRETLLENISAWDSLEGDITDKISISLVDKKDWENNRLDTRWLIKNPKGIIFKVVNSHGQISSVNSDYIIVEKKGLEKDNTPPVIFLPNDVITCYEGDYFSREDLLKGVTAWDNKDGDLTNKIQVKPESLKIKKIRDNNIGFGDTYDVIYEVRDEAGNLGKGKVLFLAYNRLIGQEEKERNERVQKILDSLAIDYYGTFHDWEAVNLSIYGKEDFINYSALLSQAQKLISQGKRKVTDYERITISLTAAGFDVQNLPMSDGSRINLIEAIANHESMVWNTDYIFALLAYDSGNYSTPEGAKWTRKALIDFLLDAQLPGGGWALLDNEKNLNVDATAMAIQALAPYRNQAKVGQALDKALNRMAGYKTEEFGFEYSPGGDETCESTAQVLLALVTMGIDPKTDYRYSNQGKRDVVDGLLSFATGSNHFTHTKVPVPGYDVGDNDISTWQAFQALAAYQNFKKKGGKAPYYPFRFKDFSQEKPGKNPSKPDKPIDPDTVVTLRDLEILSLPYQTTYEEGEEPSLDGLKVRASYSDGAREILNNRDLNVFDFSTSSWSPNRIVTIAYGGLKTTFSIQVKEKEGDHKDQANILVKDPKGRTYFPAQSLSIRPGEDTAFSLLQKTGLTYKYNYHKTYSGVYVSAIEGLAEFDGGPNSGWMYRVNGVFPNHSASLHKIYAGDKVEWLYTRDLGKDLGAKMEETDNYTITVRHNQGGTVAPSGSIQVKKNQNFTLRILPDKGYVIDRVLIDGQDQGKIESYSFYSVDKDHRVDVSFVQVKDVETKEPINQGNKTLRDIPGHWAQGAMTYCLDKGYFAGKGDGTFGANDPVSRGDLVTVLGRRRKAPVKAEKVFKDVDPNTYYGPYVAWSKKQGLVAGYHGNFRPKDSMTREEMAKVFQEYLKVEKKLSKREKRTFKDQKKLSSWAKESVDSLTSQGILQGDEQGNFNPKSPLTRAQVAQVLYQIDQQ